MNKAKQTAIGVSIVMASMFGLTGVAMADTNTSTSTNTTGTLTASTGSNTLSGSTSTDTNVSTDTNTTSGNTTVDGSGSTSVSGSTSTSTDGNTTSGSTSTDASGSTSTGTSTTSTSSPTSYLYFVQQVTQAVNVALANNDIQRAALLAQYGQDEITAANDLMKAGQTDAANQLLNDAAANQLIAASSTPSTTTSSTGSTSTSTSGNTTSTNGSPSSDSATQVNKQIANNITALAQALQNVQNPTAQAAIERNLAKAFAHLQHRLTVVGKHGKHRWNMPAGLSLNVSGSTSGATQTTGSTGDNSTGTNVSGNATGSVNTSGSSTTVGGSSNTTGTHDFAMKAFDDGQNAVQNIVPKHFSTHGHFQSESRGNIRINIGRGDH